MISHINKYFKKSGLKSVLLPEDSFIQKYETETKQKLNRTPKVQIWMSKEFLRSPKRNTNKRALVLI